MTIESLLAQYGYLVIVLGTFLEGETVLVLAGFAAHRGYLELPWVIVCAFLGTMIGDQVWFWLGRRQGSKLLAKRPHWHNKVERVTRLLDAHETALILSFRFLYGIRTVAPFVIGLGKVSAVRYLVLNVAGAALWAVVVGSLGYVFGHALELFIADVKRYEILVIGAGVLIGAAVWIFWLWRERKKKHALRSGREQH